MWVTNWPNIFVDQDQFRDPDFISGTHQRKNVQFVDKDVRFVFLGVILNMEIVEFRENETSGSMEMDPNRTFWTENGSENILTVQAIRLFFILGKSEHVKIGKNKVIVSELSTLDNDRETRLHPLGTTGRSENTLGRLQGDLQ